MPYVNNNPASFINYFSTEAVVTCKYNNCCYDVVRFVTFNKGQETLKEIYRLSFLKKTIRIE